MFWNKDKIPNLKEKEEDKDLFKLEAEEDFEEERPIVEESARKEEKIEIEKTKPKKVNYKKLNKFMNIILGIIIIIGVFIMIDVISVSRLGKGPYFALNVKNDNNGAVKVYYGIGYKVIKYKEINGRNDTVIGSWKMKINTIPKKVDMLDLALEFNNNFTTSLEQYMNEYLRVTGEVYSIKGNTLTLIYKDEEEKYTTKLICNVLNNGKNHEKEEMVTLVGTLYNYSKKKTLNLNMKNCYIK